MCFCLAHHLNLIRKCFHEPSSYYVFFKNTSNPDLDIHINMPYGTVKAEVLIIASNILRLFRAIKSSANYGRNMDLLE